MSALTYATAQILRALPRARIGRALGRLADHEWSPGLGRAVVGLYSRVYDVQFDECAEGGGWGSFDAFFTRRLRDGARDVDADPHAAVSPADGRVEAIGPIDGRGTFVVKGRPYTVAELVGDADEARRFAGGAGCVVYLSPRDYHRVHAPVGGTIARIRSMPGDYFPVNSIGFRHVPNLLVRNRRVTIEIDAERGLGRVTVIMVAAMIVGRITTLGVAGRDVPPGDHVFDPPLRVARGDELGVFHLGSTAVLLVERGDAVRWVVGEGPIRYGQPLLRWLGAAENGVTPSRAGRGSHLGASFLGGSEPEAGG
jgi:phosphatidylserine decarboxylase